MVYLFPKLVANLVQVLFGQESLLAPVSHPSLVCLIVMQGKYGVNILPFPKLWSDIRAAFLNGCGQHIVDSSQALRIGLGPWGRFAIGSGVSKPVKPVADTAQVRRHILSI